MREPRIGAAAALAASAAAVTSARDGSRAHAAPGAPCAAGVRAASLRTNIAWTAVGNAVYAGCQWGVLVAVAHLSSPEVVGTLALAYALTAPLFLLAGLQLRASQATDAGRRFRLEDYAAVTGAGMTAALIVTGGVVLLSGYDPWTKLVILGVGASKAIEGLSELCYGALQRDERMRSIAVSLMVRGVLSIATVAAVLWAGGPLVVAVAAMALSWALVLIAHDRRAVRRGGAAAAPRGARVDLAVARGIALRSLPLGLVMMLISLRANLPRYAIERQFGAVELGIFAALSSLLVAGNVVVAALGQSATPRLARYHLEGAVAAFRRLVARLLALAVAVGGVGLAISLLAGGPLLRVVFGPRYADRADVLAWLMAAGVAAYAASILGYALTAAQRFAIQLPLFSATTLLCGAGCAWLVPAHGLVGAAYAWGGSLAVELVATGTILERALRARAAKGAP
jgi:O-antigen/teichoic acid export membrane protein